MALSNKTTRGNSHYCCFTHERAISSPGAHTSLETSPIKPHNTPGKSSLAGFGWLLCSLRPKLGFFGFILTANTSLPANRRQLKTFGEPTIAKKIQ
jgi:hypothetical protein